MIYFTKNFDKNARVSIVDSPGPFAEMVFRSSFVKEVFLKTSQNL